MEWLKSILGSLLGVQTKVWAYLGIVLAAVLAVWFLVSTGKKLEKAKATEQRIEIIQKSNEVQNEVKSLPPAARDKSLDQWMRDGKPKPKPKEGNGHSK